MKTVEAKAAAPEQPGIQVHLAGIAELFAAAQEFEPSNMAPLEGLSDLTRINMVTSAGAIRRLVHALAVIRGAQT